MSAAGRWPLAQSHSHGTGVVIRKDMRSLAARSLTRESRPHGGRVMDAEANRHVAAESYPVRLV